LCLWTPRLWVDIMLVHYVGGSGFRVSWEFCFGMPSRASGVWGFGGLGGRCLRDVYFPAPLGFAMCRCLQHYLLRVYDQMGAFLVVRPVDVFIPPSLWVLQHRAFVSRVPRACRPFPAAIPQRYPNGAPAAVLELCGLGWGQWPAGRKLRTPLWSKPRLEVVSS
jgi:hypothetical protein